MYNLPHKSLVHFSITGSKHFWTTLLKIRSEYKQNKISVECKKNHWNFLSWIPVILVTILVQQLHHHRFHCKRKCRGGKNVAMLCKFPQSFLFLLFYDDAITKIYITNRSIMEWKCCCVLYRILFVIVYILVQ